MLVLAIAHAEKERRRRPSAKASDFLALDSEMRARLLCSSACAAIKAGHPSKRTELICERVKCRSAFLVLQKAQITGWPCSDRMYFGTMTLVVSTPRLSR
jgi:hypothetical protein